MAKKRKKSTAYSRMLKAGSNYCKTGSAAARKRLISAISAYRKKAKASGKTAAQINKTVARVTKCSK